VGDADAAGAAPLRQAAGPIHVQCSPWTRSRSRRGNLSWTLGAGECALAPACGGPGA